MADDVMVNPSRRSVLAGGTAAAADAALVGPGIASAPARAAEPLADGGAPGAAAAGPREDIWHTVLDDADLVWQRMPTTWYEGPYLGNGLLGSGIYAELGAATKAVRFNVQHSEVQDQRPEFGSLFGLARLPIGHFTLEPVGTITGIDWRLGLRDAELTGTLTTTAGTLRLRAFVHTCAPVLAVEIEPSAGERDFRWVFHPAEAISPRAAFHPRPDGYQGNPPAVIERHGELTAAVQPLLAGGEVAPAYRGASAGVPRATDIRLRTGPSTLTSNGYGVGIPGRNPPTPEVGNLVWALHNVWLSYRHTMDRTVLRDILFPLLREAVNYYLHFLTPGTDGKLHLPATFSPEYGVDAPDCTYDLMLLRWGCRTLLDSARELGVEDPLSGRWEEVLAKLVPYPVDANGYMIGAGVPFAKSHRHYSHLLAVYPLYEITGRTAEERALIETSLNHWVSFEGALQGYTFTGAASMSALLGKGEDALGYLGELMRRFIRPNTMYKESGPVIETPLSAAQSVHDMVCHSWGDVIRVFPAVPDAWRDLTVHDFRTQGAFLLSAVRQDGVTRWVRLVSEAGAPCVVRHGIAGPVDVRDGRGRLLRYEDAGEGTVRIALRRGDSALITARGDRPDPVVRPVTPNAPAAPWGLPA